MKLHVAFHGGTRFDITSGAHRVVTDQPIEDGGQGAGMSPVELFVGSLAGCVGYFVGQYCDRHQIPSTGLNIEADWAMAEQPHRVGRITLAIHVPHRITAEQSERLLKVAQACTVHRSMTVPASVTIELNPHHRQGNHP